jgi:hypothetical protein
MSEIERRLQRLEGPGEPGPISSPADNTPFLRLAAWVSALALLRGGEPPYTVDEAGAFFTLRGRFVVSERYLSGAALLRKAELEETSSPERWSRFLAHDERAKDLLDQLLELAEVADIPEDFESPGDDASTREEVDGPEGVFVDDEERVLSRSLAWLLVHHPDARAMLAEITRRRGAFARVEEEYT